MCRPILPSPSRTVNLESGTVSVPVNNPARQLAQAMIFLAPQDLNYSTVVSPTYASNQGGFGKLLINISSTSP